jgi:antibiotic biosynthesis monooxygenase (ABM) superfamily enzyme|tara:strand:- start:650 stop:814 length:165 start_codon:yes stop_codon:yes gene_type:complete
MDKYKSSFLNNCFEWLFTKEENAPMGFIPTFFTIIVVTIITGVFIIPIINKLMQ